MKFRAVVPSIYGKNNQTITRSCTGRDLVTEFSLSETILAAGLGKMGLVFSAGRSQVNQGLHVLLHCHL